MFVAMLNDYDPAVFLVTPGTEVMGPTMLKLWIAGSAGPVSALGVIQVVITLIVLGLGRRCSESVPVPDLQISGLSKAFDDNVALDDVAIDGKDGELLHAARAERLREVDHPVVDRRPARSGSGPDRRRRRRAVRHEQGIDLPPEAAQCGVVFQSYAVWPNMTVADNVGYPLKLRRVKGADRAARVREVLDLVELGDLARPLPAPALGRPAAAGRPRPGAGVPARPAAAR